MPMAKFVKRLASDVTGATAVEYGLILAMIFLAMIAAVQTFADEAIGMWTDVGTKVEGATSQND